MDNAAGMAALAALGARSIPVVSRGGEFVFAQVISDVAAFLGITEDTAPELSADELISRYRGILETAIELVRLMPDQALENQLPNRPRSWRVLMHHVFQIPNAFLDAETTNDTLTYENLILAPPERMRSSASIATFGEEVLGRFVQWSQTAKGQDFSSSVATYFGDTSRHEMLERTVWHSTQHVRQIASLLEQTGVTPTRSLTPQDLVGLPLTEKIWDDEPS